MDKTNHQPNGINPKENLMKVNRYSGSSKRQRPSCGSVDPAPPQAVAAAAADMLPPVSQQQQQQQQQQKRGACGSGPGCGAEGGCSGQRTQQSTPRQQEDDANAALVDLQDRRLVNIVAACFDLLWAAQSAWNWHTCNVIPPVRAHAVKRLRTPLNLQGVHRVAIRDQGCNAEGKEEGPEDLLPHTHAQPDRPGGLAGKIYIWQPLIPGSSVKRQL